MTPTQSSVEYCDCHKVVKKEVEDLKEDVHDITTTREKIWAAINAKLPNAIFYMFLSIIVPLLGYIVISQYAMNERLIRIEERVKIMQEMGVYQ